MNVDKLTLCNATVGSDSVMQRVYQVATIPDDTRRLIALRNKRRRQWYRRRDPIYQDITALNRRIREECDQANFKKFKETLSTLNDNRDTLWRITKALRKTSKYSPPLRQGDNIIASPTEKAQLLVTSFAKAETATVVNESIAFIDHTQLTDAHSWLIRPKEVARIIRRLKSKKSSGQDNIRNCVLKKLPRKAHIFLAKIFSACIRLGYFPNSWKHAVVVAIPKPNTDSTNAFNYRPISLLPTFSKLLERVILIRIEQHLENTHIIPDDQSLESTVSKTPSRNAKSLLNSTDVTIPKDVELLLSMGRKFALPYTNMNELPIYHLIADVESIIQTNRVEEIQERNRCAVANQIQNFLHAERGKEKHDPTTNFYRTTTKATREFLTQHPELVIIEADKGNKTVVMKREDYDRKLQHMIDDEDTYRKLNRDPTSTYQKRNNEFAKRLAELKLVDRATEMRLKTYKATSPRIYGAPKAHKEGLPLRPVVPCMTSPSYTLSQFVGKIIQKSIVGRYNVTDSFSFCQLINNVQLPPDYVLISLDVVSLFTCIPKGLVIRDVIDNWDNIKKNTDINLDLFLEITEFCIDCSYFRFKGKYFQQVCGTAMGNPLSPPLRT
ncbi:uncharacterized protein LOC134222944 [Armigeres subalbatus]|uniref:uncharacterized protein LOC134222944 n=1 Tax=Armigeres subalbatus TaxID=124917 RepID=UPI002ED455F6